MAWTTPRTWVDGELVTAALLNTHVRDNLNAIGPHVQVVKSADESVTSSVTLQNDDELLIPVLANERWFVVLIGAVTAGAGGFKFHFDVPAGATFAYQYIYQDGASFNIGNGNATQTNTFINSGTNQPFRVEGVLVNGATPGNLTLQWAQASSNAAATTIEGGTDRTSYIDAHRG